MCMRTPLSMNRACAARGRLEAPIPSRSLGTRTETCLQGPKMARPVHPLGLCTRCSGFYLLCYALILSKCPYYAQSLHPLCSLYTHYAASCLSDYMCFFKLLDLRDSSSRQALQKAVRSRLAESASPGSSFKR